MDEKKLAQDYREWILAHELKEGKFEIDGDIVEIKTDYAEGQVKFHEITLDGREIVVIEQLVTNLADDENKYYLHFELKDLAHAQKLFEDMLDVLFELKDQQKTKILLCCTSGLTTSFFKEKLNEAANLFGMNFEFNAVNFSQLYKAGFDYSVILLAPQIAFRFEEAREVLRDKIVLKVPPKMFARYDVPEMIKLIQTEIENRKSTAEERAIAKAVGEIKNDKKILSIAVMPFANKTRIAYRIYENGSPIFEETIIKGELNVVRDLEDIMDTVGWKSHSYDAIGVAISGTVHDGHLDLPRYIDGRINLKSYLEDLYGVPVVITNNLRGAVLGFYAQQDKYRNIVFNSKPKGYTVGGQAILIDGKLINGAHNMAGEIRYFAPLEEYGIQDCFDVDRILEIISREIRSAIGVVDPEVICVRSELTPNMQKIREKIAERIPEKYIPELIYIDPDQFQELILLGQMIITLEELEKSN